MGRNDFNNVVAKISGKDQLNTNFSLWKLVEILFVIIS